MKISVLPFEQPMGLFLAGVMKAADILRFSKIDRRRYDAITLDPGDGFQREPSARRIVEIAGYAETVDATFPTPILLALEGDGFIYSDGEVEILREGVADIIDGQHRILGLQKSNCVESFQLPVVFILDPTEEQKALIFATINGKQTKVPASLVYDLFGVTTKPSPQKTAHEIVRALNKDERSPWFRRLKMLGKKLVAGSNESLSQGTFVKFLLAQISDKPMEDMDMVKRGKPLSERPNCIFNEYWRKRQDENILKVLLNVFSAARQCWPHEWDHPDESILTKTLGFSGIMRALPQLFENGKRSGDLSLDYFQKIFESTKLIMAEKNLGLKSSFFSQSATGEAEFSKLIIAGLSRSGLKK